MSNPFDTPGRVILPGVVATMGTLALTAGRLYLAPFEIPKSTHIGAIRSALTVAASGGPLTMEAGLFRGANGGFLRQSARVSISISGAGNRTTALSTPLGLAAGLYYAALWCPTHTTMPTVRATTFFVEGNPSIAGATTTNVSTFFVDGLPGLPQEIDPTTLALADGIASPVLGLEVADLRVHPALGATGAVNVRQQNNALPATIQARGSRNNPPVLPS